MVMTGEIVSIPGRTVVYGINRMYKCTNNVKALTSAQSYIYTSDGIFASWYVH